MKATFVCTAVLTLMLLLSGCSSNKSANSEAPAAQPPGVAVDQATVGSITGKVAFTGEKPKLPEIHMDQDPVCMQKHKSAVDVQDGAVNDNGTLPYAFVYVKQGAEKYAFPIPRQPATIDQDGCMYKPHVLGIMVGQDLHVVTSDNTTHNIHAMPKINEEWDESQPPGAAPIDKKFTKPEIMVPVKCNQHPWMRAYIGVTSNPLFSVTNDQGTFTINGVPPGDYTLAVWTSNYGTEEQKVTVAPKQSTTADFTLK